METPWLFRILTIISNNSIKYLKKHKYGDSADPRLNVNPLLVDLGMDGGVLNGVDVP